MRLGVGVALIYHSDLFGTLGEPITVARDLIEAAGGILMLVGVWSPVAGALVAMDELWIALSLDSSQPESRLIHIFLAVLAAGVAMLGPGAWSIDARLFGRKRFKMRDPVQVRKPPL